MAQSSVSAQIRALEDDLDVKLFDRIGRRILLTDAGRKLFEYARRMEDMTEKIHSELTGAASTGATPMSNWCSSTAPTGSLGRS